MCKNRLLRPALAGFLILTAAHACATTFTEPFTTDPQQDGWRIFGDTNLFQWDSTNQDLRVTWDSTQSNSYFYHPLGTILTREDNFQLAFDLRLNSATVANYGSEIAIGLLNRDEATATNFVRADASVFTGPFGAPNLVEWDFFPDAGYGPTLWPGCIDSTNRLYVAGGDYSHVYALYGPRLGDWYHVVMTYTATNQTLTTTMTNFEQTDGVIVTSPLSADTNFGDFRLNTVSINNYADDGFGDSVFADGDVDNFAITVPPPPVQLLRGAFSNGTWQVEFIGQTNWLYTLERTTNWSSWTTVSPETAGVDGTLKLSDPTPPPGAAYYRVRANQP